MNFCGLLDKYMSKDNKTVAKDIAHKLEASKKYIEENFKGIEI